MKWAEDGEKDVVEDTRPRGLIWAARRSHSRDDDESVEDNLERSRTEDGACDSHINLPKVA